MKRALVTGGAGFIGSELTQLLLKQGYSVTVFDDLSFGRRSHLWNGVRFVRGDLRSKSALARVLRHRYDAVFHLAALHFIPYCNQHPEETFSVNVEGTAALLNALRRKKPKRLFFASTAAVYAPSDRPHREAEIPKPMDIYGLTKLCGEHLVRQFSIETGVPVAIGRLFNAYGPRETNPHLIPAILSQIQKGKRKIDLGNLKPYRDYIHTSDIARAIVLLASRAKRTAVVANIGSGHEYSVQEVVNLFSKALGKKLSIRSRPALQRKVERMHLRPDLRILKGLTRFLPKVDLADGLSRLIS